VTVITIGFVVHSNSEQLQRLSPNLVIGTSHLFSRICNLVLSLPDQKNLCMNYI